MKENLNTILDEIKASLRDMQQNEALQELKVKYLGKKGEITQMMKQMGSLSPEERPAFGQKINALRKKAEKRPAGGRKDRRHPAQPEKPHRRPASSDKGILGDPLDFRPYGIHGGGRPGDRAGQIQF